MAKSWLVAFVRLSTWRGLVGVGLGGEGAAEEGGEGMVVDM